jgi:hypothetical protein
LSVIGILSLFLTLLLTLFQTPTLGLLLRFLHCRRIGEIPGPNVGLGGAPGQITSTSSSSGIWRAIAGAKMSGSRSPLRLV